MVTRNYTTRDIAVEGNCCTYNHSDVIQEITKQDDTMHVQFEMMEFSTGRL